MAEPTLPITPSENTAPAADPSDGSSDADLYTAALAAMAAVADAEEAAPPPVEEKPAGEEKPAEETKQETPVENVDDLAALRKTLDARQARRAEKTQAADLARQVQQLQAQLQAQKSRGGPDPVALLRQNPIEGLRALGVDPIEFYGQFKDAAIDPSAHKQKTQAEQIAAKIEGLEQKLQAEAQAREEAATQARVDQAKRLYVQHTDDKTKYPYLSQLDPEERLEMGIDAARALTQAGHGNVGDDVLARYAELKLKRTIERFRPAEAGTTNPTKAPGDGAADNAPKAKPPASLSNQIAAQSSGSKKHLTEQERWEASIRAMEAADRSQ
jgi:hypothetical protein